MKRSVLASVGAAVVASSGWLACATHGAGLVHDGGNASDGGLMALGVTCTDPSASIYADPGSVTALPTGDITKFTADPDISVSDLQTSANANISEDDPPAQNIGYTGK